MVNLFPAVIVAVVIALLPHKMLASFYGHGERLNVFTSNGERFDPNALTAAHRTLPFNSRLRVCLKRCVVVRVNDRGPAQHTGRDLDVTKEAAIEIGLYECGIAMVSVTLVG